MLNYVCKLIYLSVFAWHNKDLFNFRDVVLARALLWDRKCKNYIDGYNYGAELWHKYDEEHILKMISFYSVGVLTKYEQGLVNGMHHSISHIQQCRLLINKGV